MTPDQLHQQWTAYASRAESFLDALLKPRRDLPEGFVNVLRYSVLGGGKRIRPVLCMAAAEAAGVSPELALVPGCAIELIHAYSLVHDDLPAMDNDDERRGQPTVHRKFDEPTAILAGDGLQAEAFLVLSALPGARSATPLASHKCCDQQDSAWPSLSLIAASWARKRGFISPPLAGLPREGAGGVRREWKYDLGHRIDQDG
jgi:geranylgeranyl pyrophosphate synthase